MTRPIRECSVTRRKIAAQNADIAYYFWAGVKDGLKLADRLQAGGFTADQARAAASALAEVASGFDLATKSDVQTLAVTTKRDLVDLEQRLIIRLGGLAVVLTGLALAVMHYLPPHG